MLFKLPPSLIQITHKFSPHQWAMLLCIIVLSGIRGGYSCNRCRKPVCILRHKDLFSPFFPSPPPPPPFLHLLLFSTVNSKGWRVGWKLQQFRKLWRPLQQWTCYCVCTNLLNFRELHCILIYGLYVPFSNPPSIKHKYTWNKDLLANC